MNEILLKTMILAGGFVLGTFFFGGLWFTIKKALSSKKPILWFLGSLGLRAGITLAGFYYIALGNWMNLLLCLFGFITARLLVLRLTKARHTKPCELKKEI